MKSLFWEKTRFTEGTIWTGKRNVQVDYKRLEQQFHSIIIKKDTNQIAKSKKVSLYNVRRGMSIGVRLSKLGIPWNSIYRAVIEMDNYLFQDSERISCIIECIPKEDERPLFATFMMANSIPAFAELTEAEQLGLQLLKIPRVLERVQACS